MTYNFIFHSNEIACRKMRRLGMDPINNNLTVTLIIKFHHNQTLVSLVSWYEPHNLHGEVRHYTCSRIWKPDDRHFVQDHKVKTHFLLFLISTQWFWISSCIFHQISLRLIGNIDKYLPNKRPWLYCLCKDACRVV